MAQTAVRAEGLGKKYRLGARPAYGRLTESVFGALRSPFDRHDRSAKVEEGFWAVRDLSFEVEPGEVLGIVGPNGAGKTTLLKLLSRITEPTEGFAEVTGRAGSLLEVGTGFHPELTGRENVYLNGAILGMTKREITRRFDEIVAFAEVDKFLDTPVKRYSSGMYVRLAFAVAAHLDPDVLIVDEVLSVGDASFQRKSLGRMSDVAQAGRTVLFVSHNLRSIAELCTRCIWLAGGRIEADGSPSDVIGAYMRSIRSGPGLGRITPEMHTHPSGNLYFENVNLVAPSGERTGTVPFGAPLRLAIEFEVREPLDDVRLIVAIERLDGALSAVLHHTDHTSQPALRLERGRYEIEMETEVFLTPGGHTVHLAAKQTPGYWGVGKTMDWVQRATDFFVEEFSTTGYPALPSGAATAPPGKWSIRPMGRQADARNT